MHIRRIELFRFKRFRFAGIKSFEADFNAPVTVICGQNGHGKGLRHGTLVKVMNHELATWIPIEKLQVGHYILAPDGKYNEVIGIYPQGKQRIYRIHFEDGRYINTDKSHLWNARTPISIVDQIFSTEDIIDHLRVHTPIFIPLLEGDNCYYTNETYSQYVSPDIIEISKMKTELTNFLFRKAKRAFTIFPKDITHICLKEPLEFKAPIHHIDSNIRDRKIRLRGLLDTGARKFFYSHTRQQLCYCTIDKCLAYKIQQLVWSVGGICQVIVKNIDPSFRSEMDDLFNIDRSKLYYLFIRIRSYKDILSQENAKHIKDSYDRSTNYLKITSIEEIGKDETTCIKVKSDRELYVAGDYIVTHNTSLLNALCPLPQARSEFDMDGYKRLFIEHDNKEFVLSTDFRNRTSPHSFLVDGCELNVGGTTDVQEELVIKHLGITPSLRNLIYNKTQLTKTTRAERKQLFLNINPMKLGLILETHKKAMQKIKDCKANLTHLYTRKSDIEHRLIPYDILQRNITTAEDLKNQVSLLEKMIYSLDQHILSLKNIYQGDIDYREKCVSNNIPVLDTTSIIENCKKIQHQLFHFRNIDTTTYQDQLEQLKLQHSQVITKIASISRNIEELSKEINEYHKHLDTSSQTTSKNLEQELKIVEEQLTKYQDLPKLPIPQESIEYHQELLNKIQEKLFFLRDYPGEILYEDEYVKILTDNNKFSEQILSITSRINQLTTLIANIEQDIKEVSSTSGVPLDCKRSDCKLQSTFISRVNKLQDDLKSYNSELTVLQKDLKQIKESKEYQDTVKTFSLLQEYKYIEHFNNLLNYVLQDYYFQSVQSKEDILTSLAFDPMYVYKDLEKYIQDSLTYGEYITLKQKQQKLSTELTAYIKSSEVSSEFILSKLKEKEEQLNNNLKQLDQTEQVKSNLESDLKVFHDFTDAIATVHKLEDKYQQGERSLLVTKSIQYWSKLSEYLTNVKIQINTKLRELETTVKDQEILRTTYEKEIISHIKTYEQDKVEYEHIELALSPTTGLPHKSMVKYLNSMIHNVNYFLSQIWSYRLQLQKVSEDEALDYAFRVEVGNEVNDDISKLSDGQSEIMNLSWILTILLQLKLLSNTPLFADELGRTFDNYHRAQLLQFLDRLIENKVVNQMMLVSHDPIIAQGFNHCDLICLSPDTIRELPANTNEYVKMS